MSQIFQSGQNANARAVEREPVDPDETLYTNMQSVWAMSVCSSPHGSGICFLYMLMDSGAEEHVISNAGWRHLGGPSLSPAQARLAVPLVTTCEYLAVFSCAAGMTNSCWKSLLWLQLVSLFAVVTLQSMRQLHGTERNEPFSTMAQQLIDASW